MVKLKLKNSQLLLNLYTYTYVASLNVYGKTPPRFGENAVTLPVDVDRPCFLMTQLFLMTLGERLKKLHS